jgi:hypothetical protein
MNKDKIQIGDLVCFCSHGPVKEHYGIGLLTGAHRSRGVMYAEVYWFKLERIELFSFRYLTKLEIPNE